MTTESDPHEALATRDDQHPGRPCCESCAQDEAYDFSYSLYPQCCCRSDWESD